MVQTVSPDPERRPGGTIRSRHRSAWRERWAQALISGAREPVRAPSVREGSTSVTGVEVAVV
jgi:hypothetical protein